ncbi:MAG: hypothetical protein NTZ72_15995 [Afipia sp.]|nr:hypothetical protein [Afipia sp.]
MNALVKQAQPDTDGERQIEWVIQRARVMSAGLRLLLHEIDEIGISLKHGWMTPERAASDLAALEKLPVHIASMFYLGGHEC